MAQFGVVILSPSFFQKKWPQWELDALVGLARYPEKVILPVWHGVTAEDVERYSKRLAANVGVSTGGAADQVLIRLIRAVRAARKQGEIRPWIRFNPSRGWPTNWLSKLG